MRPQGRSGEVSAKPLEIVDPPEFITDAMVARFTELQEKRAEWRRWCELDKQWKTALRDQVEELRVKLNSTL